MKKLFATLAAVVFVFVSCDPKEKGGEGSKLTPDQNKEKLEQIAVGLANQLSADDFTDFTDAVDYLANGINLPDDFRGEKDGPNPEPAGSLARAAAPLFQGDLSVLNRLNAAATRAADYAAADIYGIYTYNETTEAWDKAESTSELTFKYDYNGDQVAITIKGSGSETNVTVEGETVAVPSGATLKMTIGSATVLDVAVNIPSVDTDATAGQVKTSIMLCGYSIGTDINLTKSGVSAIVLVRKGSTVLVDVNASASGSNFSPASDGAPNVGKVGATVGIMGELFLKAGSGNLQKYIDGMDDLDDEYRNDEYGYAEYDEAGAKKAAKLFNDNVSVFMNYDNSDYKIAKMQMKALEYGNDGWDFEPYIVFSSDNSWFTFSDYFDENDFSDVFDAFDDLAKEFDEFFNDEDPYYPDLAK